MQEDVQILNVIRYFFYYYYFILFKFIFLIIELQPVIKESGCNRVECLACHFHICWKCDAFYKD